MDIPTYRWNEQELDLMVETGITPEQLSMYMALPAEDQQLVRDMLDGLSPDLTGKVDLCIYLATFPHFAAAFARTTSDDDNADWDQS